MQQQIKDIIQSSIQLKQDILKNPTIVGAIEQTVQELVQRFKAGNKLLLCGNGGSAADAQHIASEFTAKYLEDRPPLFAEALTVNSSYITAAANDYSYDQVFSRMVEAKGRAGDVLLAISTSGTSVNVLNAAKKAAEKEVLVVGLTAGDGAELAKLSDILIAVPKEKTPRIQESHIMIGHIICEIVEREIFK